MSEHRRLIDAVLLFLACFQCNSALGKIECLNNKMGCDDYASLSDIAVSTIVMVQDLEETLRAMKTYGVTAVEAVGELVADQQQGCMLAFPSRIVFVKQKGQRRSYEYLIMIKYTIRQFPNKKWYLFTHDDTFIFKPPLLEMLAKYEPEQRVIIGQRTCQPRQVQCRIGRLYGADQDGAATKVQDQNALMLKEYQERTFTPEALAYYHEHPFGGKALSLSLFITESLDYCYYEILKYRGMSSMRLACYLADSRVELVDEPGFNTHSQIGSPGDPEICQLCPHNLGVDNRMDKTCRIPPGEIKGRISMHHLESIKGMTRIDNETFSAVYECCAGFQQAHDPVIIPLYYNTSEQQDFDFIFA